VVNIGVKTSFLQAYPADIAAQEYTEGLATAIKYKAQR
jgi:hypothetical protein